MAAKFVERLAGTTFRLRAVIGLAFTLILLLSAGSLVWLDHQGSLRLLQKQVDEQFDILVSGVTSRVALQFDSAGAVLDTLSMNPPPMGDPQAVGAVLVRVLASLATTSPAALSIITGSSDGRYVLVQRLQPSMRPRPQTPSSGADPATYSIRTGEISKGRASESETRLDAGFSVLSQALPVEVDYDARDRPWYTLAVPTPDAVTTPPYRFRDSGRYGITMSRRTVADPARVFGIDIRLDSLSESLRRGLVFEREHVVIFAPDGALVGDSGGLKLDGKLGDNAPDGGAGHERFALRLDTALYAAYRDGSDHRDVTLDVDGEAIYANIATFKVNGASLVVASAVPAAVFEDPATRLLLWSLLIQAGIIAISFVLVSLASLSISRPIQVLASDVENIIEFRFPDRLRRQSRIREIQRLLAAVDTLELTLRAFSKYMPLRFVQTIVDRGIAPELGGRRQPVIVMFSDVEGFTSIAETLAPDELMPQLSRYFSEISDEILASGGTIDKFIGDSVMAFWPLPDERPEQVTLVCSAVLRASDRVDAINAIFRDEGRPALPTRFGLHAGEAMIGSVGTPNRMNYTALGHTVNVASRIEQLNKTYGTRLLVSAAIRDRASPEVRLRYVDAATVRGTHEPLEVYELLPTEPRSGGVARQTGTAPAHEASSAG